MQCGSCPLLQPGAPNAGYVEQVADGILAYPRCLWLSRKVTPVYREDRWEVSYEIPGYGQFEDPYFPREPYELDNEREECDFWLTVGLCLPFNFIFLQIPALILSAVGMPIKATVIAIDDKALSYSILAENYLLHRNLLAEKVLAENKINENLHEIRMERETSKKQLVELQSVMKNFKKPDELSPFHLNVDPFHSELKNINIKIEQCERQIEQAQNKCLL